MDHGGRVAKSTGRSGHSFAIGPRRSRWTGIAYGGVTISLGRIGVWAPVRLWENEGAGLAAAAAELDELGFGAIWLGNGQAILDVASSILDSTSRITVATGIVNIWVHDADSVAARCTELAVRHPGRFLLGLGNGPREPAQWRLSPYQRLVDYLDRLDAVPPYARVIGAAGPRMLALAATRSRGAHPFLTTPEHTQQARQILGPGPLLAPELKVVLDTDPTAARATARQALQFYLAKRGYTTTLRRLGFADADLATGGSDRLIDAVAPFGPGALARIHEHLEAGADHVAIQPLTTNPELPRDQYRQLAQALL
jgi:probable F420-dependent oxidoreductase